MNVFSNEFAVSRPKTTVAFVGETLKNESPYVLGYDWKWLKGNSPDLFHKMAVEFLRAGHLGWLEEKASFDFYSEHLPFMKRAEANQLIIEDSHSHFEKAYPKAFEALKPLFDDARQGMSVMESSPLQGLCYGMHDDEAVNESMRKKASFIISNNLFNKHDGACPINIQVLSGRHPPEFLKSMLENDTLMSMFIERVNTAQNMHQLISGTFRQAKEPCGSMLAAALIERGVLSREHLDNNDLPVAARNLLAKKLGLAIPLCLEFSSGVYVHNVQVTTKSSLAHIYFGSGGLQLLANDFAEARAKFGSGDKVTKMLATATCVELMKTEAHRGSFRFQIGKKTIKAGTFAGLFLFEPLLGKTYLNERPAQRKEMLADARKFCDEITRPSTACPPDFASEAGGAGRAIA